MKPQILLADNHCHICTQYFDDPIKEIENLELESGLKYIISMGVEYDNDRELIELKKRYYKSSFFKIGIGLHPEEVIKLGKFVKYEVDRIKNLAKEHSNLIDYIGEIGMDFTYLGSRELKNEQIQVFWEMCNLAVDMKKPISIHARESFDEIIQVVEKIYKPSSGFNGYLHCFTGNFDQGIFFIERGFKLGLSGIITYKKSDNLRKTVKDLIKFYSDRNINDIFGLETDSPYLTPEPFRSHKNNPKNLKLIAEYIQKNIIS